MKLLHALLALALAACSSETTSQEADAGVDPPDAAVGASSSRAELTGGARMTGGTLVVDVQLTPIHH